MDRIVIPNNHTITGAFELDINSRTSETGFRSELIEKDYFCSLILLYFYNINNVIILNKINNFRLINKHLEEVNSKLPVDGILMGSFETFIARAQKKAIYKIPVLKQIYFAGISLFPASKNTLFDSSAPSRVVSISKFKSNGWIRIGSSYS